MKLVHEKGELDLTSAPMEFEHGVIAVKALFSALLFVEGNVYRPETWGPTQQMLAAAVSKFPLMIEYTPNGLRPFRISVGTMFLPLELVAALIAEHEVKPTARVLASYADDGNNYVKDNFRLPPGIKVVGTTTLWNAVGMGLKPDAS